MCVQCVSWTGASGPGGGSTSRVGGGGTSRTTLVHVNAC